jgi:FkbM family methyltransferase
MSWGYRTWVRVVPVEAGKWRLGQLLRPWLVTRLDTGPWIRVSGVSDFEWHALHRRRSGEAATTALFCDHIVPGGVVVDAGANIGFFTLTAALRVGAAGRVVAFEPDTRAAARLAENVALNRFSNITIVPAALGAVAGRASFHRAPDSEASSVFAADPGGGSAGEVAVVTLDGYLAEAGITRVDLLKIDAEGSEIDLLVGASQLLSGPERPPIIVEANPVTLRAAGRTVDDLRALLTGQGYAVSIIERMQWRGELVENWLASRI